MRVLACVQLRSPVLTPVGEWRHWIDSHADSGYVLFPVGIRMVAMATVLTRVLQWPIKTPLGKLTTYLTYFLTLRLLPQTPPTPPHPPTPTQPPRYTCLYICTWASMVCGCPGDVFIPFRPWLAFDYIENTTWTERWISGVLCQGI